MLDFNGLDRINKLAGLIKSSAAAKVLIDHHPGPAIDTDLTISETAMSSTAELVFELVAGLNNGYFLEEKFIEAIYVGMMTDTGNFNFGTFDGDTMRTVGLMLDSGLDKDYITDRVYDNFSVSRMRFKGYVLNEKMICLEDFSTAYICISAEELKRYNYVEGDTEGFVNLPLSISGIVFSALFIERSEYIKVSLRSKGDLDVNAIASSHFNGGGHRNAAGGKFFGNMEDCKKHFETVIKGIPLLQ
jgi:phosphoesterase RecJ-like protein